MEAWEAWPLVDSPAFIPFDPSSRVEEVCGKIFSLGADVAVNVIDATNLERKVGT